jgi:hypothetical protein
MHLWDIFSPDRNGRMIFLDTVAFDRYPDGVNPNNPDTVESYLIAQEKYSPNIRVKRCNDSQSRARFSRKARNKKKKG